MISISLTIMLVLRLWTKVGSFVGCKKPSPSLSIRIIFLIKDMKFWVKKQEGFIEGNAVDFLSIFLFPSASVFGARVTEPKNGGL